MRKTKSQKNPYGYQKRIDYTEAHFDSVLKKQFPNINFEIMNNGPNGEAYYFEIDSPVNLKFSDLSKTNLLLKGKYLLKISWVLPTNKEIEDQSILSDFNLIPKIYFGEFYKIPHRSGTDEFYFSVQQFEEGIDLRKLYLKKQITPALKKWIYNEVKKEYEKWSLLYVGNGDLKFSNILITIKGKVYLIDPLFGKTNKRNVESDVKFFENFYLWYNDENFDKNYTR